MHISKIYIQDNFIPNINRDQFRRKVFGMEITIKEGEDVGQAISEAETHIANYIKINTVPMDDECRGTKVRDIVETKVDAIQATLDEIEKCKTPDELKTLWLISKSNLTLSGAYKLKEKSFNDAK